MSFEKIEQEKKEGVDIEMEKINRDPIRKFIREKMGVNPEEGFYFRYGFIKNIERDPNDPEKIIKIEEDEADNYHDYLQESKEEFRGNFKDEKGEEVESPIIIMHGEDWDRLEKDGDLNKFSDQFHSVVDDSFGKRLEDEFAQFMEDKDREEGKKEKPDLKEEAIEGKEGAGNNWEYFGFGEQDIISEIPNFEKLSEGQRLLLLENFKQVTLARIQKEAPEQQKKLMQDFKSKKDRFWQLKGDIEETIEHQKVFWSNLWENVTKSYTIRKFKKEAADNIQKGGIEDHREVLQQLVHGMVDEETGEVKSHDVIEKEGELEIQYLNIEDFNEKDKEQVEKFNEIATEYSKMPYEWSLKEASKEDQEKFNEVRKRYEDVKKKILNLEAETEGGLESALFVNGINEKIQLEQFIKSHPEVEDQLQNIKDEKIWKNIFKDMVTSKGIYAAAGFITRTVTAKMIGLAALPIAAAGVGGYRGWKEGKKELQEQATEKRGVAEIGKEKREEIRKLTGDIGNARYRISQINKELEGDTELTPKEENDLKAELSEEKRKLKKLEKQEQQKMLEDRDYVDAKYLHESLYNLVQDLKGDKISDNAREEMVRSLKFHVEDTDNKIENGTVNFGSGDDRLYNQSELMEKLGQARSFVVANEMFKKGKIEEKYKEDKEVIEKFLESEVEKLSKAEVAHIRKKTLKGAAIAGGFALGGYGIRYVGEELGWWGGAGEAPKSVEGVEVQKEGFVITGEGVPSDGGEEIAGEGEPIREVAKDDDETAVEAPVSKKEVIDITIKRGDSIWTASEKYLDAKYGEGFSGLGGGDENAGEALKTYNIDRVKDKIAEIVDSDDMELKKRFGLEGVDNIDNVTVEQLKNINFNEIDKDVFGSAEGGELTEALSKEEVGDIIENNRKLKEFFEKHPDAPRTTTNYEAILEDEHGGDTGEIKKPEAVSVEASVVSEPVVGPEKPKTAMPTLEERKQNLLKYTHSYLFGPEQAFDEKTAQEVYDLTGGETEKMNFLKEHTELLKDNEKAKEIFDIASEPKQGIDISHKNVLDYYDTVKDVESIEKQRSLIELFMNPSNEAPKSLEVLLKGSGVLENETLNKISATVSGEKLIIHYDILKKPDFDIIIDKNGTAIAKPNTIFSFLSQKKFNSLDKLTDILKLPVKA